jgi:hypothetical protein
MYARSFDVDQSTSSLVLEARSRILVILRKCLLQQPLVALGLVVQVAFIVITITEMDMMRTIVTRRSDRLSLAEASIPCRLSLSILIHSRRSSCYFAVLLSLHLLELLVLSLLEL